MAQRWCACLAAGVALLATSVGLRAGGPAPQAPAAPIAAATTSRAILDRYCVSCHNDRTRTAGLSLDTLDVTRVGADAVTWEKVARKLRGRMMPPAGLPRPDEITYDAVAAHLETSLDRAAAARPNPGRTDTFRRLNRTEY